MSTLWPAALAAAAVGCLLALPTGAGLRLQQVVPARPQRRAGPSGTRGWLVTGRAGGGRTAAGPVLGALLLGVLLLGVLLLGALLLGVLLAAAGGAGGDGRLAARLSGAVLSSAVPVLLVAGGVLAAVRVRRRARQAAARQEERGRAVEACAALSAELRAGRSPADALLAAAEVATGPCRTALSTAAGAARLGGSPAAALQPPPSTAVPDVLRSLAACWSVCAGTGSGLAAAVERLEEGLRADQAQRRAVQAELAGPRATAGLLAVLPAGGLLLAAGLGADPLRVLLSTPMGLVCLTGGLLLDGLGLWWTGRLVDRASGGR